MRRATILAFSTISLASVALLPIACTQDFNMFESSMGTGASSGSSSSKSGGGGGTSTGQTSTTSSTSSSSNGSSSSGGGCTSAAQCDDTNPCTTDACAKGTCTHTSVADGPVPGYTDTVKDCKTEACTGGMVTTVADDSDVPDNSNPCVTLSCMNENVVTTNVSSGTTCGNGQTCDGNGNCIGCNHNGDCPAMTCQTATCSMHTCVYANQPSATPCNSGGGLYCDSNGMCVQCLMGGQCPSNMCMNGSCAVAMNGQSCNADNGCMSNHCVDGVCCNSDCTGNCMACTNALTGKSDGTCANVLSGKAAPTGQCQANGTCANDGKCDGNGGCEQTPQGMACGMTACANGIVTNGGTCDGAGKCGGGGTTSCNGFVCASMTTCKTTCNVGNNAGCLAGYSCSNSGGSDACLGPAGTPCTTGSECASGTCLSLDAGADAGVGACM